MRLRRTGPSNVDIQDRRGQGGGSIGGIPMGAALGGGGGAIGLVITALLLVTGQCSGAGSQGGGFGLPQDVGGQGAAAVGGASGVTCDSDVARLVCDVTTDVQDYWTDEYPKVSDNQPYERTQTVFFSDATQTGCGTASAQTGPFYCPADRLVYFDLGFLQQLQSQFGAQGDFATAYIVAHEYGHHIQNLLGLSAQVSQFEQQNPSRANEMSIRLELQADCLAGAWGATLKNSTDPERQLESGDIEEALGAAQAVGDDRIQEATQGRTDPETWNHGNARDREHWFQVGFDSGDPGRCNTFTDDADIQSIRG
jgi:predicted metalloprotease